MRWLLWLALLLCGCSKFEGYSKTPYPDPIGVTTVCAGHRITNDKEIKSYDWQECGILWLADQAQSAASVLRCSRPITLGQFLAYNDLAYNVGRASFCRSSVARMSRQGRVLKSCRNLARYVYARGKKLSGLVKRRAYYQKMCETNEWPDLPR